MDGDALTQIAEFARQKQSLSSTKTSEICGIPQPRDDTTGEEEYSD
jgi:hypothetical protein